MKRDRGSVRASTIPAGASSENGNRTPDVVLEIVYERPADSYRVVSKTSPEKGEAVPAAKYREDGAFGPALSTLRPVAVEPELSILKITTGSSVSFSRLEFVVEGETERSLVLVQGGM